jgi:hypothetical protein
MGEKPICKARGTIFQCNRTVDTEGQLCFWHASDNQDRKTREMIESAVAQKENLEGACFRRNTNLKGLSLTSVKLVEADFSGAMLKGSSLESCDLWRAKFHDTELHESSFRNCMLMETQFHGASLSNCNFEGAVMRGTILQGSCLRGARLGKANIQGVDFTGASWLKGFRVQEELDGDFATSAATYQKLKQEHERIGSGARAGEFYYREREMQRKLCTKILERLNQGFFWALWGYGERPWRILGWLVGLTVTSSILAVILFPKDFSFHRALLFAGGSFFKIGYSWIGIPPVVAQYLGIFESFLGTIITTLFLVALVRRILR